jgi:hypothetical protein
VKQESRKVPDCSDRNHTQEIAMKIRTPFLLVAMLFLTTQASAHHSGAPYDSSKQIEVSGVVEEWSFGNPHAWLRLNVKDDDGKDVVWNIEATSANILLKQGWRRNTVKYGDPITVLVHPLRDGSPGGSLMGARLEDGTELGAPPGSSGSSSKESGSGY